jgi:hypothetical protein
LWLADGYWRSSSIGLSSTNEELIRRFERFLIKVIPDRQIKYRYYEISETRKHRGIHVYVNSRALTRLFLKFKTGNLNIPIKFLLPYLAGRIDGDGHIDLKHRSGVRIAYGNEFDAKRDLDMLLAYEEKSANLYRYFRARTWVIHLSKRFFESVKPKLRKYCMKLLPRRD